jgi:two-component system sensor histidine kinase/response regulator
MPDGKMILVVEDDDTLRLLATKQLAKLGFTGHAAADGSEAVAKTRVMPYSLILMDVQMPKMDGLEATTAIRKLEEVKHDKRVPIIAMTANPDRERCLKAGMDDFIFKPVLLAQLRDLLERWVPDTAKAEKI